MNRALPAAVAAVLLLAGLAAVAQESPPSALGQLRTLTGVPAIRALARPPRPALPADSLLVPLHTQETDYSCGAAALLAILRHRAAFQGAERDLYGSLETTPKDGTEPGKIVEAALAHGLSAQTRLGMTLDDLRAAVSRRQTVILDIQAWPTDGSTSGSGSPRTPWRDRWEDGHYVVLIGMDSAYAYVMDPVLEGAYGFLPLGELEERWHDYEDRRGSVERNHRLGVVIGGGRPAAVPASPRPLERVE